MLLTLPNVWGRSSLPPWERDDHQSQEHEYTVDPCAVGNAHLHLYTIVDEVYT